LSSKFLCDTIKEEGGIGMSDYFKFCPKCGRVLDREWCPHCEPEKEKAFRKQQMKMESDMFENYSRAPSEKGFFKQKHEANPNKKTQTKTFARKKTKKEKGKKSKRISYIIIIVVFLISFVPNIWNLFDFNVDSVENSFSDWMDDGSYTIDRYSFDNLMNMDDYSAFVPDAVYHLDRDQDSDYTYELENWDGETYEFGYYFNTYSFYNEDQEKASAPTQVQIDQIYEEWKERAATAKENQQRVQGTLDTLVTYYDDNSACLIIQGSEYFYKNDNEDPYKTNWEIYSFVVDLNTMEVYTNDDFITFDDNFYENAMDENDEFSLTEDEMKQLVDAGKYHCCIDRDGILWVCFETEDSEYPSYNVEVDTITFDGTTIDQKV
jgi:hypothetical protein